MEDCIEGDCIQGDCFQGDCILGGCILEIVSREKKKKTLVILLPNLYRFLLIKLLGEKINKNEYKEAVFINE